MVRMAHKQNLEHYRFFNENNLPNLNKIFMNSHLLPQESEKFHNKNVEYFTLMTFYKTNMYPFSFESLKHLKICGTFSINDVLCKWIGHIKNLKTLTMLGTCVRDFNPDSFRKIMQIVRSSIVEMHFLYLKRMSVDDVVSFLKESRHLKKLCIYMDTKFVGSMETNYYTFTEQDFSNLMQKIKSNLDVRWTYNVRKDAEDLGRYIGDCLIIEREIDEF